MRILAISDIHGCPKTFQTLVEEQVQLTPADHLFLLGDYMDRGPDHFGVIAYIQQLQTQGYRVTCLMGNHDATFIERANINGKHLKPEVRTFFEELQFYAMYDNFIFVHAGFNFKQADPFADRYAQLWIRDWYAHIDYNWLGDRIIVHGHTPALRPDIIRMVELPTLQAIGIDNACFVLNNANYGKMCAVDLTNREIFFQENKDMFWRR